MENGIGSSGQMLFFSSPMKSIYLFSSPFSRQPSLSKHVSQSSSSSHCSVPEVFISVHGWQHRIAGLTMVNNDSQTVAELFIQRGRKIIHQCAHGIDYTAATHTLSKRRLQSQLNQLITTQTVFRGGKREKELTLMHIIVKEDTQPGGQPSNNI